MIKKLQKPPTLPKKFSPRLLLILAIPIALFGIYTVFFGKAATSCTTTLNSGANVSQAVNSVAAGGTVCLNAGTYQWNGGSWATVNKSAMTTIAAAPSVTDRSQVTTGYVNLALSNNVRFEGITIGGLEIGNDSSPATNIQVANSNITDMSTIRTPTNTDTNILFDGNTLANISAGGGYEGRITVRGYNNNAINGVELVGNTFGPSGCSDGVQIIGGAYGTLIKSNTFTQLRQGSCAPHVDAIQLYGSNRTEIDGNYFADSTTEIASYDGGSNTIIRNNVLLRSEVSYPIVLGGESSPIIEHNTLGPGLHINLTSKAGQTTTNATVRNNITPGGVVGSNGVGGNATFASGGPNYNLCSSSCPGANSIAGTAVYVGGANPTTFAGFALATNSPGKNAASDGKDMGADASGGGTDTTPPDTTITTSTPANGASTTATTASISFSGTDNIGVTSFECSLDSTTTYSTCTSPKSYPGLTTGSHTIRVRAKDAAGNTDASPASITFTITSTSTCSTKQGDANNDNVVNILDISAILTTYGQTSTTNCADVTKDTSINIQDISLVLSKYGT